MEQVKGRGSSRWKVFKMLMVMYTGLPSTAWKVVEQPLDQSTNCSHTTCPPSSGSTIMFEYNQQC